MLKELHITLNVLNNFNKQKEYVNKKELQERYENLEEVAHLINQLHECIQQLESVDMQNSEKIINTLLQLHHIYVDFIWHFGQIDDLITDIARQEHRNTK